MREQDKLFILATQRWVESIVIALNLCPFAKREVIKNRVHYIVCHSNDTQSLLTQLEQAATEFVNNTDIETTLLIHPHVLQNFEDYNAFLDPAEQRLQALGYKGILQLASFHPHYQFAGTSPMDPENYTNRSPFPLLHLLKESSLEKAISAYPDTGQIPEDNIALMNQLGQRRLKQLVQNCIQY